MAQSAHAAVPTYTQALTLVDASSAFGHDIVGKGTSFVDHFTFNIVTNSDMLDGGFYANQGKIDGINITGFNLLNSLGAVVLSGTGAGGAWTIETPVVGAGSFALEVIGTVTGNQHGSYNGTLNVSTVPEPETYGMLLAGLGLVGFAARRKARKAA